MDKYLKPSEYIDSNHPAVMEKAAELSAGLGKAEDIARASFEFARDCVRHSWDYKLNPVTCRASDVLLHGTGYCYSKSHLLAALLRANKIPAGLCYQRLPKETEGPPFCLHGLNAVFIKPYGWYRIDARGNKPGVCADFCPPVEKLAFPVLTGSGECDVPGIFAEPLESVISVLTGYDTVELVYENLPDIKING
ncbi:MAG: transglutaminase-like domain-containing protein [bacterium]